MAYLMPEHSSCSCMAQWKYTPAKPSGEACPKTDSRTTGRQQQSWQHHHRAGLKAGFAAYTCCKSRFLSFPYNACPAATTCCLRRCHRQTPKLLLHMHSCDYLHDQVFVHNCNCLSCWVVAVAQSTCVHHIQGNTATPSTTHSPRTRRDNTKTEDGDKGE